jgi:hypothetical protein
MIAKALAVPSTTTVSTANNGKRVFIAASLLGTSNLPRIVPNFRGQNVAKDRAIFSLARAFAMSARCPIAYRTLKEPAYQKLKEAACWNLKETAYQMLKEAD